MALTMNLLQKIQYRTLFKFLLENQEDDLCRYRLHKAIFRMQKRPELREMAEQVYKDAGSPTIRPVPWLVPNPGDNFAARMDAITKGIPLKELLVTAGKLKNKMERRSSRVST